MIGARNYTCAREGCGRLVSLTAIKLRAGARRYCDDDPRCVAEGMEAIRRARKKWLREHPEERGPDEQD